jgi:hypothetical protein
VLWLATEGTGSVTTPLGQYGCGLAQVGAGQREGNAVWALRDKSRLSVVSFPFFSPCLQLSISFLKRQLSNSARVGAIEAALCGVV